MRSRWAFSRLSCTDIAISLPSPDTVLPRCPPARMASELQNKLEDKMNCPPTTPRWAEDHRRRWKQSFPVIQHSPPRGATASEGGRSAIRPAFAAAQHVERSDNVARYCPRRGDGGFAQALQITPLITLHRCGDALPRHRPHIRFDLIKGPSRRLSRGYSSLRLSASSTAAGTASAFLARLITIHTASAGEPHGRRHSRGKKQEVAMAAGAI